MPERVNKLLLSGAQPWLTDAARIVFPIFAIVLTYYIVTHADPAARGRALKRTLIAACIAQPVHAWAFG